jgi:hypothetical protein
MYENRVLRRMFRDWRRLHNEELHNLYASPNIIKEDEMGGTCNMPEGDAYNFWLESLNGRDHLEVLGIDGEIILEWMFELWTACVWFSMGTSDSLL